MQSGLVSENGKLIYYRDGRPCHAGVIRENGKIYYISSGGKAVRGEHVVHGRMANGILKRGTYTFGGDGVLVPGSYKSPRLRLRGSSRRSGNRSRRMLLLALGGTIVIVVLFLLLTLHGRGSSTGGQSSTGGDSFGISDVGEVGEVGEIKPVE